MDDTRCSQKSDSEKSLADIVRELPLTPGCYLFKDSCDQVLYVGKSKSLRSRVSSYFMQQKDERIAQLMRFVEDVSYQSTMTDIEAILLEHRLIKTYRPPYNIRMQKDRQHWYIKIDLNQTYPGMYVVSEETKVAEATAEDKATSKRKSEMFIGAFYKQEHAETALEVLGEYWKTPTCGFGKRPKTIKAKSPCLRYHIQCCLGPCACCASTEEYQSVIQEVIAFLCGSYEVVLHEMEKIIQEASQAMAYEKASKLQNQYNDLNNLARYLKNMPPELEGKNYYVLLKSRHEDNFLLLYLKEKCAQAWMRFEMSSEWEIKSRAMIRYVEHGEMPETSLLEDFLVFDSEDGLRIADAVLEVDAVRIFTDIKELNVEFAKL